MTCTTPQSIKMFDSTKKPRMPWCYKSIWCKCSVPSSVVKNPMFKCMRWILGLTCICSMKSSLFQYPSPYSKKTLADHGIDGSCFSHTNHLISTVGNGWYSLVLGMKNLRNFSFVVHSPLLMVLWNSCKMWKWRSSMGSVATQSAAKSSITASDKSIFWIKVRVWLRGAFNFLNFGSWSRGARSLFFGLLELNRINFGARSICQLSTWSVSAAYPPAVDVHDQGDPSAS